MKQEYDITLFFSNSNICPKEEYEKRREDARKISATYLTPIIEDQYNHAEWRGFIRGLEGAHEGGLRCLKCFVYSLGRTSDYAKKHGFDLWTTTLTISPHKNSEALLSIGKKLGGFLEIDFKKKHGFRHSAELSRKYGLYRQQYCGCIYSERDRYIPRSPEK